MRIVFPTKDNLSYISKTSKSLEDAVYLTVLNVKGQNIVEVETFKNHHYNDQLELIKEFKKNNFKVLMIPNDELLPIDKLKEEGISIYKDNSSESVLKMFSEFVQDKLEKL